MEQATSLSLRQGRRAGADAIAPVRRGGTLRPGATGGVAGPTGVESRSARGQDDAGRAGHVPGHVVAPHPGPGHSCRRKHGRVPEDERGTAGSGDAGAGDGPA